MQLGLEDWEPSTGSGGRKARCNKYTCVHLLQWLPFPQKLLYGTFIFIYLHSMNPPPAPHIPYMEVHPRVADAIASGVPVVAMETTIVTHGMPYPENLKYDRKLTGGFC